MKQQTQTLMNKRNIFPITEIVLGSILLIREIYQFTILPSVHDYYGPIDFGKYKENTYPLMFLWSLLIILGILSLKNEKLKWISNQILIVTIIILVSTLLINTIIQSEAVSVILGMVLMGLTILEIKLYQKDRRAKLNISIRHIMTGILFGVLSAFTYLTLFYFFIFIG